MVMYQIPITRLLQIYIGMGSIVAFFFFLGYKTLKKGKKKMNLFFSLYYIFSAIGMIVNFIYAPIRISEIVTPLHYITFYLIALAPIFLLAFSLIFLKTEEIFTTKKQAILIIGYALLLSGMFFFPNGVEINENTGWYPHWKWPLSIYVIIVFTIICVVPNLYFSIKLYNQFNDDQIKKKWKFFMIGLCELFFLIYGTILIHAINDSALRSIFALISIVLCVTGAYLLYYGYARKFKSK